MTGTRRLLMRIEGCPFCARAEEALDAAGINYEKVDVNPRDRSIVELLSGQPTVPILVEVVGCRDQDDDIVEYIQVLKGQ